MSDALAVVNAVMGDLHGEARGVPNWRLLQSLANHGAPRGGGRGGGRGGAGGFAGGFWAAFAGHSARSYAGAVAGQDEALVKIVTRGGTHDLTELRKQVTYVAREGDVDLYGATAFGMEAPLTEAEIEETLSLWAEGWDRDLKHGHTIHMVVSFPEDTDPAAALVAGRAFGETAFGGSYGDTWDYIAALHTDRAHPHVHLMINRHGLDQGQLLSTYRGDALNLDRLREIQVETAGEQGIELTATSRLARGIRDLAPGTRDYRRAMESSTGIHGRSRSARSLVYAEKRMKRHAEAYRSVARVFQGKAKFEPMEALMNAAHILNQGAQIMANPQAFRPEDFKSLEDARGQIAAGIQRAEKHVAAISDPAERAAREIRLGELKGEASRFLPERADFALHADRPSIEMHKSDSLRQLQSQVEKASDIGPEASDSVKAASVAARQALQRASQSIAAEAEAIGVDGKAFVARYAAGGPRDAGTAAQWAARDIVAILRKQEVNPERAGSPERIQAARTLDALHRTAEAAYSTAARDLAQVLDRGRDRVSDTPGHQPDQASREDARSAEGRALVQQAKEARQVVESTKDRLATPTEIQVLRSFAATVEKTLARDDLAKAQSGDPRGFRQLGASAVEQAGLARAYLEVKTDLADEQGKSQLAEPLERARAADVTERAKALRYTRGREDERER